MPPILPPSDQYFLQKIRWLDKMVRKLAMQQSGTYAKPGKANVSTNYNPGETTPVMNVGSIPPTPQDTSQRYGVQTVDSSGNQRLMVGEQADGTHGLWAYGPPASGSNYVPVLKLGEIASGEYALQILDPSGNVVVQLGEQTNGDYALSVAAPNGSAANELWPVSCTYSDTALSTASATPVSLSGSPSVTAYLGASGDCLLTISAYIGVPANSTGVVYLTIDGTDAGEYVDLSNSGTAGIAGNVQSTRKLSQWYGSTLSPSTNHTFGLEFSSSSGTSNFGALSIVVQPL